MAKAPYLKDIKERATNLAYALYLSDRKLTNKEICKNINEKLQKEHRREVSQSIVDQIMVEIHAKERSGDFLLPQDEPWSIGSCIYYGIPRDLIMLLTELQEFFVKFGSPMTIRQAQWIAYLYPSIQKLTGKASMDLFGMLIQATIYRNVKLDEKQANFLIEQYKISKNDNQQTRQAKLEVFLLYAIGIQYAKLDQISALSYKAYPDTSELDELYFKKSEITVEALMDGLWLISSTSEQKKQREEKIANFKGYSREELEPVFGELNAKEMEMANDLLRAFNAGYAPGHEWMENHPEEWAQLEKKMEAKQK